PQPDGYARLVPCSPSGRRQTQRSPGWGTSDALAFAVSGGTTQRPCSDQTPGSRAGRRASASCAAMAVVMDGREEARAVAAWGRSPRWRGVTRAPRSVLEALLLVLPLTGPAMVVAYLVRAYHPHPGWVDGHYYRDGGFLFDLHTMWHAGHEVVMGI